MTTIVALVLLAQRPVFTQAVVSGIVVTEFDTPEGRIQVYLPQDMAAGDTISGTVFAEPKGTGAEREANDKVLQGVVVSIDAQYGERNGQRIVFRGLDKGHKLSRSLKTKTYSDGPTYEATIKVEEERSDKTLQFVIPEVAPAGRPMSIAGPFDGDIGTTTVSVGGKPATVFVETPRRCVLQADTSFTGKKSVSVSDGGVVGEGSVFLPRINLTATKTALARGEKSTLTVTVQGLDDAPASLFPIPVELKNMSPSIIDMPAQMNFGVEYADVRDGAWTRTVVVTASNPGSFVVTGLLFAVSMHDAKSAMTPAQFRDWCKALIVVYEQKIKDLEPRKAEAGFAQNIAIKQNLVRVLKVGAQVSTEGEKGIAATMVDKELATQSFFAMASDLITMAADMLGYTTIPLPNVGTLLKGAAALAKGSEKALEAVKAAQAIYDGISTAQDAKDKAQSLKDALQKVKEALQ